MSSSLRPGRAAIRYSPNRQRVPRQFTESDTLFLRSYANLLAGAVDRLRLRLALEETVAERTRELTEANARLQAEAAERGRVEEALRQSLKMEAVGQLTGGLAHDFNNLLAGISGSLALMRLRMAQGRAAEIGRYIEIAMTSVNRAAALTHRLLAFARRQTLDPKPTNVNRLVAGMEELFIRTVGPGIRVETKLATDLWTVLCDPNQLENALLNLVLNARDAMPGGGHLLIETRNSIFPSREASKVPLGKVPAGEYMGLFVIDTGVGMPPGGDRTRLRPFLHDQTDRRGNRPRLVDDLRLCPAIRRPRAPEQQKGPGHDSVDLPARASWTADGIGAVDTETMPSQAETGAVVCWSRTRLRCG